jgi:putative (di)nucleoside polyphosphate hydrolase
LARFLPRVNHHNRYLRSGMRHARHDDEPRAEQPGSPALPEAPG